MLNHHMKTNEFALMLVTVVVLGAGRLSAAPEDISNRISNSKRFLLDTTGDLRLLLIDTTTLSNCVTSGCCLIHMSHGRGRSVPSATLKVPLKPKMCFNEILKQEGLESIHHQIRLFRQNAILQSAASKPLDDPAAVSLMESEISPGDVIIMTTTREW
jgi:hypothetical protein